MAHLSRLTARTRYLRPVFPPGTKFANTDSMRFAMVNPTKVLAWRMRSVVIAVIALGALQAHAAVLPLSGDAGVSLGGQRAGLLDTPMVAVSGEWVGHT